MNCYGSAEHIPSRNTVYKCWQAVYNLVLNRPLENYLCQLAGHHASSHLAALMLDTHAVSIGFVMVSPIVMVSDFLMRLMRHLPLCLEFK